MVLEGVFERYPDLKVVLIECGFGWLPALGWRLDKQLEAHARRGPATHPRAVGIYPRALLRLHPADGGDRSPDHALDAMRWIGFDRILFASDYPHWDFDDPAMALPPGLGDEARRMVLADNARAVYRLD